ncbi:hypothetical protein MCEMSE15_01387 [Fimbriimonadaceae bacterium]
MIATLVLTLAMQTPGLAVGDEVAPFEPYWVSGPYTDTRQCPVCEYGIMPLVIVWSQLKSPDRLKPILAGINETVGQAPNGRQKAFLVDLNETAGDEKSRKELKALAEAWKLPKVFFMSRVFSTKAVQKDYKLQPYSDWETIVYVAKNRLVTAKFVNPKLADLKQIQEAIRATTK